jgi:DNA-binding response OmpR family regulator
MSIQETNILLVEDDVDLAGSLQTVIRDAGFACDVAFDGETGLQLAETGDYALVVLDILLPARNGFQVCAQLRKRQLSMPILMLTAKSGEWDQVESLDLGADDFLVKPVSTIVLVAHLRALLRRSKLTPGQQLSCDGVTLDPLKRRCTHGGNQLTLSGREVEVLARLMIAEGTIVAKDRLVRDVWGEDFDGDQNIAEVYIRHLRAKLEPTFGRSVITTVHGVGYRFTTTVRP